MITELISTEQDNSVKMEYTIDIPVNTRLRVTVYGKAGLSKEEILDLIDRSAIANGELGDGLGSVEISASIDNNYEYVYIEDENGQDIVD